jgi:predicted patatin/cPLA2 family phospholipase
MCLMPDDHRFDAIGFAGGGNRCYWQSGFFDAFTARFAQRPDYYVAVSAGAYHCAFNIIGKGQEVREKAYAFCARGYPDTNWKQLARGRSPFGVGGLFRAFLTEIFGPDELAALKAQPPILIQIAVLPTAMPAMLGALGAIGAYQIEKLLTGGAHSKAGRYLGLKPSWVSTHEMQTPGELVDALMATSSVPPFMPVGMTKSTACLDGGLVDNPPLLKLSETEMAGGKTLLLTTRYGRQPSKSRNRIIVGPSADLTINKFTVRDADGLRRCYDLGFKDGERFVKDRLDGS